jgi:inner membrane protein
MADYDEIRAALNHIGADDRDMWIRMGAAVKDEMGEDGFHLWDEWSQTSGNYNTRDAKAAWKSFKAGHISIGTLFYHARQNGWRPEKPYVPLSDAEKARRQAESEAKRLEAERLRQEGYERVKGTAQRIWAQSVPATLAHPYLTAKGITDPAVVSGIRQNEYNDSLRLQIPVFYDGQLYNLQSIAPTGDKRFLKDGRKDGGYTVIGDASKISNGVVIAEGFATAASIHQATGQPVIVAFDADNMVKVSETLARNLPSDTKVTIAVDNDASGKGLHSARQAAAFFGDRAVAIEPEFSMQQIQKFQQTARMDKQGRPKLPSDYNDLHQLAGIEAVRKALTEGRNLAAPASEHRIQLDTDMEQAIADEIAEWQARQQAADRGHTAESSDRSSESPASEQSGKQKEEEMIQQTETLQAVTSSQAEVNGIEYAEKRRERPTEPYQPIDPDHPYGIGRTGSHFGDAPPLETDEHGKAKYFYESDFAKYQLDDARTDIRYVRTSPEAIQKDLDTAGDINFYYGITESGRTVMFTKTEQGWQSPQPGNRPVPAQDRAEPPPQRESDTEPLRALQNEGRKAILDLNYNIPPDSIAHRYIVSDGKYMSAENGTTVMFTDKGNKLSTARSDAQTVNDMLEVVKEKGWDNIKLTGSKEFKRAMFLAAESRGIRTAGYRPTKEDLAYLDHLREERALNGVEERHTREPVKTGESNSPSPYHNKNPDRSSEKAVPTREQSSVPAEGERIVTVGSAPYLHNAQNKESPYIVLERSGKERTVWGVDIPDAMERSGAEVGDRIRLHSLGRQPVEVEVPIYDKDGKVTGMETKAAYRNMFDMEIVREQEKQKEHETSVSQPDTAALSKADEMLARSKTPSDATINTSHTADTQAGVPLQGIGQGEIPAEVAVRAAKMKSDALDTRLQSSKAVYMTKAGKLSKANKSHLQFHERNVMDAIRGVKGDARKLALANYYEHTAEKMKGSKLDLPKPVQIPSPQHSLGQVRQQNDRDRQHEKEQEMEQGR